MYAKLQLINRSVPEGNVRFISLRPIDNLKAIHYVRTPMGSNKIRYATNILTNRNYLVDYYAFTDELDIATANYIDPNDASFSIPKVLDLKFRFTNPGEDVIIGVAVPDVNTVRGFLTYTAIDLSQGVKLNEYNGICTTSDLEASSEDYCFDASDNRFYIKLTAKQRPPAAGTSIPYSKDTLVRIRQNQ